MLSANIRIVGLFMWICVEFCSMNEETWVINHGSPYFLPHKKWDKFGFTFFCISILYVCYIRAVGLRYNPKNPLLFEIPTGPSQPEENSEEDTDVPQENRKQVQFQDLDEEDYGGKVISDFENNIKMGEFVFFIVETLNYCFLQI